MIRVFVFNSLYFGVYYNSKDMEDLQKEIKEFINKRD